MTTSRKLSTAIIIVGGAAAAMLLGPNGPLGGFWRPLPLSPEPAGAQLAGLIGVGAVEALGFGAAIAVLVLGGALFSRITTTARKAAVARVAAAWLLGSWWPHSALHRHFGLDPDALAVLEVVFHAGSIVAFGALLWAVLSARARDAREQHLAAR